MLIVRDMKEQGVWRIIPQKCPSGEDWEPLNFGKTQPTGLFIVWMDFYGLKIVYHAKSASVIGGYCEK